MFKRILVSTNHEIVKTHDLIQLNKLCKNYNPDFVDIQNECLRLTDFAVNFRYPYPLEINEDDMNYAIKDAEKIKSFILKLF